MLIHALQRKREEDLVQRYRNTRIKRSAILGQPQMVMGLSRECDQLSRTARRDVTSLVWARGLSIKHALNFQPRTCPHLGRSSREHNISAVIYDELSGSLIVGVNSDGGYGSTVLSVTGASEGVVRSRC